MVINYANNQAQFIKTRFTGDKEAINGGLCRIENSILILKHKLKNEKEIDKKVIKKEISLIIKNAQEIENLLLT